MLTSTALFTARALVDELARGGVQTVCVAPGSRSTALALAVAERNDLSTHVLTDERSMAFFALGIARASGAPVAVVCTSGTAVANLLPAVIESALGSGSLILLTADRPPELRDCASPQTIDQVGIFGSHARWAVDVPLLDSTAGGARVLRSLASRAVAIAVEGDGGPVHLNVPLREPFVDASFPSRAAFAVAAREDGRPFTEVTGRTAMCPEHAALLAERLGRAKRGVIVCAGRGLPAPAIALLAKALGWPVLADPLSGLRFGDHDRSQVCDAVEPLLRDDALRHELRPDAVVRFGLTPPPRSVQRWLDEAWPAEYVAVSESAWPDPTRSVATVVRSGASEFCRAVASACGSPNHEALAWKDRWLAMSAASRAAMDAGLESGSSLFDGIVLREVVRALPADATVFVGNSMPVRDAETFLAAEPRNLRVMANRGASGIDGVVSTALGVAMASTVAVAAATSGTRNLRDTAEVPRATTALVVGDLSFLHDSAALAFAARECIPLLIVVVNNDGGGIFSYLPLRETLAGLASTGCADSEAGDGCDAGSQSAAAADGAAAVTPRPGATTVANEAVFERFFGTPHGTDLERVASVTQGFFRRVTERTALAAAVTDALAASAAGPAVLEVCTHRERARVAHQRIVRDAQAAVAKMAPYPRRSA